MADPAGERQAELATTLATVQTRIAAACAAVDRSPGSVTLIAVTKTYPASDAATLFALGVADLGESRDQEASVKAASVAQFITVGRPDEVTGGVVREAVGPAALPRWHFVGQLQTRKCRSVVTYAQAVHSVDRDQLADGLAAACARLGRAPLEVFLQVSLDGDPRRGGVEPAKVLALADRVASAPQLRLRGVMAVAPRAADLDEAFSRLAAAAALVHSQHSDADSISAGMSGDFETAIRYGATHLRVGSALLGRRTEVFG